MSIDSTEIQNPILKRTAEGDLSVVNDINEDNYNITENVGYHGVFNPFTIAAYNGHTSIVKRLLAKNADGSYEFPYVTQNIAAENNCVLRFAAQNGHIEVVKRLLAKNDDGSYEFPEIIRGIAILSNSVLRFAAQNGHTEVVNRLLARNVDGSYEFPKIIQGIAILDNNVLRFAALNGHIEVVSRLLARNVDGSYEFPDVIQDIAILDNNALCLATERGHYEISYILARAQWPSGVKDVPQGLRWCVPAIRKGEIIVSKQEEALQECTQLFRWLQEGYIPTSRQDLYLPPRLSSKELQETTTLDFDVMNIVNKYAGTQRSIDTSRPTNAELNMISMRKFQINRQIIESYLIKSLKRAKVERESKENSCYEQDLIPYSRLGLN